MSNNEAFVKERLENAFDVPFVVEESIKNDDPCFNIRPDNINDDLFDIHVELKNNIRIVIEVIPEKYAAFSIKDMANADEGKKKIFSEYATLIVSKNAKIKFSINGNSTDPEDYTQWPKEWEDYRCRISKSPVIQENQLHKITEIVAEWAEITVGMFLSLLNVVSIEADEAGNDLYTEGGKREITVNKYERNPINRKLCLAANGYKCSICGFDFVKKYGKIGEQFINVHHIIPVSEMKTKYMVDPVNDLIPVCPNCHAMLHRKNPPIKPEELREMIELNKLNYKK